MSAAPNLAYSLLSGDDALLELASEWKALESTSTCHPFQSHDFVRLWQTHVGAAEGVRPLLITARDGSRLVGVFPAARRTVRGLPVLTWLAGPEVLDYGDLLFHPDFDAEAIDAFVGHALSLLAQDSPVAMFYFTNVRSDALACPALKRRLRVFKLATAPFLSIQGEFGDYLATRKYTLRSNLDRKLRRMQREGGARLEILEPGHGEIEQTMEHLVRYQRLRFDKGATRTSLFDERQVAFRLAQAASHPDSRLFRLVWGDRIVAALLHALRGDRLYNITSGFDAECAENSPGSILQRFAIESCFNNGWDVYDFCWGGESYKYDWASGEVELTTFVGDDVRGRALIAARTGARRIADIFGKTR